MTVWYFFDTQLFEDYNRLYRINPHYIVSMTKNNFMTVKEVADYLVVHQRTIYRYIKANKLKATNIGGWRIMTTDLQDFIKKNTNTHNAKRS